MKHTHTRLLLLSCALIVSLFTGEHTLSIDELDAIVRKSFQLRAAKRERFHHDHKLDCQFDWQMIEGGVDLSNPFQP